MMEIQNHNQNNNRIMLKLNKKNLHKSKSSKKYKNSPKKIRKRKSKKNYKLPWLFWEETKQKLQRQTNKRKRKKKKRSKDPRIIHKLNNRIQAKSKPL